MNNILQRIPLLRVLFPLIAGLCLYNIFNFTYSICIFLILILLSTLFISKKRPFARDIFIYGLIILLSYLNSSIQNIPPEPIPAEDCTFITRIDKITDNESSMNIEATVLEYISYSKAHQKHNEKILLKIQGNNYLLSPGCLISFKNQLMPIKNIGNPEEFNFKSYCNKRYIYNHQFLEKDEYLIIGSAHNINTWFENFKSKLTKLILSNHYLQSDSQNFLVTILLGSKEYFDSNIKESFVNIGLAHILALSGLHVAIIAYFIYLLLFPVDYLFNKKIRVSITIVILILYALVSGLSASVSRATILFAFGFIALAGNRKINSYNILSAAAIILLIVNPNNIYDVGFQLSFIAVLSILIFSNFFNRFPIKNIIIRYTLNLVGISVSAVIGTAIISAYYFNNLPILFIIPNVLLVPLLPFILFAGISALLFDSSILSEFFNRIYQAMQDFVLYIDSIPVSNIDYIYVSGGTLTIYFAFLILAVYLLFKNKKLQFTLTIILASIGIIIMTILRNPSAECLVIFNDYSSTPILIQSKESSVLMPNLTDENIDKFKKYNKKYIAKYRLSSLSTQIANYPKGIIINTNTILYKNKYIRVITSSKDEEWQIPESIDYLIITKKYYSSIRKLITKYNPELIILSGDIHDKRLKKIIQELEFIGINYYNIRENGAFIMD